MRKQAYPSRWGNGLLIVKHLLSLILQKALQWRSPKRGWCWFIFKNVTQMLRVVDLIFDHFFDQFSRPVLCSLPGDGNGNGHDAATPKIRCFCFRDSQLQFETWTTLARSSPSTKIHRQCLLHLPACLCQQAMTVTRQCRSVILVQCSSSASFLVAVFSKLRT